MMNIKYKPEIVLYTVYNTRTRETTIFDIIEMEKFLESVEDFQPFYLKTEPDLAFESWHVLELHGDNSSLDPLYICQEHETRLYNKIGEP